MSILTYKSQVREAQDLAKRSTRGRARDAARHDMPVQLPTMPEIVRLKLVDDFGHKFLNSGELDQFWTDFCLGYYRHDWFPWHPKGGIDCDGGPALLVDRAGGPRGAFSVVSA